jgi:CBS domain-containing protein
MTDHKSSTTSRGSADTTLAEIMRPAATTVEHDGRLASVAYLMQHADTGAVVVVESDAGSRPIGIITTRDVVRAVAHGVDAGQAKLADWMRRDVDSASPRTSINTAARMMLDGGYEHLPVVADDRLVGIVSVHEIVELHHPVSGTHRHSSGTDTAAPNRNDGGVVQSAMPTPRAGTSWRPADGGSDTDAASHEEIGSPLVW